MAENPYNVEDNFDLPRQTTHCRVLIHSHVIDNNLNGVINCSEDVVQCSTSKTIKGGGSASFTLVPRKNYINYIFPNDWVNIYFDPGDGRGYIRTFFGFVDRVERSISVSADGRSSTQYSVSCSDFTKAFDHTQIYFNPHIADRRDFIGLFAGTKNIGGTLLRMKGITVYGTPADIVMNLAHLTMGYGAQYIMPPRYPATGAYVEASRRFRKKWVKSRFSKGLQEAMGGDSLTEWLDKMKTEAQAISSTVRSGNIDNAKDILKSTASAYLSEKEQDIMVERLNDVKTFETIMNVSQEGAAALSLNLLLEAQGTNFSEVSTGLAVEATAAADIPGHLLDLIDFSFVEYEAIDGSIVSTPIWTQQGSVWAMMMSYSNDIINELFCDLRPLSLSHKDFGLDSGGYTTEPDEHGYASTDISNSSAPVRFAPALIMREHPFGTVNTIWAGEAQVLGIPVGEIYVGAIFSKEPGKSGRKIHRLPFPLNDYLRFVDPTATTIKHLDVVAINPTDIINEHLGRGDADICNLIELYSDGFMGKHMKFLTQDIQPIATPISVARYGLRVRTYTTRFGRFSNKIQNEQGVDGLGTRRKLARWVMMLDHWYQHNIEYLQGTMTTRAFPEIRVGYRLDILKRNESYYVEGVNHNWQFPEPMTTSFTLSRGQRFDPYPVYVKPELDAFHGERSTIRTNRLALFFEQCDPDAVRRALSNDEYENWTSDVSMGNIVDDPDRNAWGDNKKGFLIANADERVQYSPEESAQSLEQMKITLNKLGKFAGDTIKEFAKGFAPTVNDLQPATSWPRGSASGRGKK